METKHTIYSLGHKTRAFPVAQWSRILLPVQETQEMWVRSLGQKDPLEWKWQPTPVFLPENPMDGGGWQAAICGDTKSWT